MNYRPTYRRMLFRIYDEDIILHPPLWLNRLSPTAVIQCICFVSIDAESNRRCVYGYMYRAALVTMFTWHIQMNCEKVTLIPIESNVYVPPSTCWRQLFSEAMVLSDIYTISTNRKILVANMHRYNVLGDIIHVDISDNIYQYVYFHIYDHDIVSNIGRWIGTIDSHITYCICIKTFDVESGRVCVYGYAIYDKRVPYNGWRDSLKGASHTLRLSHGDSDRQAGINMVTTDVILEGPFIREEKGYT